MAEVADAIDLGSIVNRRAGSSPVTRTILNADTEIFGVFLCLKIKKSTITGRLHSVIEEMLMRGSSLIEISQIFGKL